MQNSMVMFTFLVFDRKYPLLPNLIPKFKIVFVEWNLVLRVIWICIMQWWCWHLPMLTGNTQIFHKFSSKIKKFLVLSEIWYQRLIRICTIQLWCSILLFSIEDVLFFGKFGWKYQKLKFELKFCTYINSNMQKSMETFNFLFLDWIYSCWVNFAKKFKIVSLSWNLIPRLFWISKNWWWCLLILILFFFWKFYQKIPFGMLVLRDYSRGSLLAETWS